MGICPISKMGRRIMRKIIKLVLVMILLIAVSACGKTDTLRNEPKPNQKPAKETVLKSVNLSNLGLNGYNQDLKMSPDGKNAALSCYSFNKEPGLFKTKLLLVNLETGSVRAWDVGDYAKVLSWRPDGKQLLYQDSGDLFIFNVDDENPKLLSNNSFYGSFSPDGKQIAFSDKEHGLMIMDVDSKNFKTFGQSKEDWYPLWYPDGKHIFYFCDLGKELGDGAGRLQGMAKISAENGVKELIMPDKQGKFREAEWIVPGKVLQVVSGWDDGYFNHIVNLEEEKIVDLGENIIGDVYHTAVDINKGILLKAYGGVVEIYNEQGGMVNKYTLPEQGQQNFDYAFSPDGGKVSFLYGEFGMGVDSKVKGRKIWVSGVNGENAKALTSEYGYYETVSWDREGKYVITVLKKNENQRDLIEGIEVFETK